MEICAKTCKTLRYVQVVRQLGWLYLQLLDDVKKGADPGWPHQSAVSAHH